MDCVAVIIAGGRGTRLAKYTEEIPKPMIPVAGKPVLEHQIRTLAKSGIRKIYITIGYLKEAVMEYFGDGSPFGVEIEYVQEDSPLGSCGAFYYLRGKIKTPAIIVYGDVLFDICLERLARFHESHDAVVTLAAHPNSHPYDSDLVICGENDRVLEFDKKGNAEQRTYYHNLVNAGFFYAEPSVFDRFQELRKTDFEKDFLSGILPEGGIYAYRTTEYIKDMGTYGRLEEADRDVRSGRLGRRNLSRKQRCVFLDRDGTLNKINGFVSSCEQLELENGVSQAIRLLNQNDFLCIVITNQPVIARNLCTLEELERIHMKLETLLGQEGAYLDDLYFCPHHPDAGYPEERREYKIVCRCRKPETELVERAQSRYHINLGESYFIGDSTVDIQTGRNAGTKTALVLTGEKGNDGKYDARPDFVFDDLLQAAERIIGS